MSPSKYSLSGGMLGKLDIASEAVTLFFLPGSFKQIVHAFSVGKIGFSANADAISHLPFRL
jgi:hypothetical protein